MSLISLSCVGNYISSLNLSQNTLLVDLNCRQNSLSSLNLSNNASLADLSCKLNDLTSLDLSQNSQISFVDCSQNNISSLDLCPGSLLYHLSCDNNNISSLDLSQSPNLWSLNCSFNNISSLNLSNNTDLVVLDCDYNFITWLDLSHNVNINNISVQHNRLSCFNLKIGYTNFISNLDAAGNPDLECILVDNLSLSINNQIYLDPWASLSLNCPDACNLSNNENLYLTNSLNLFPNPTTERVNIELNKFMSKVTVYLSNSLGEVIFHHEYEDTNQISFNIDSTDGIYYLKINSDSSNSQIIKIVKG